MSSHGNSKRESRSLRAARKLFSGLADILDARFSVQLWDGTMIPLGQNVDSPFYVSIHHSGVLGSILRRPTPENILSHYVKGEIDVRGGDLPDFIKVARARHAKKRLKQASKLSIIRAALPLLLSRTHDGASLEHSFQQSKRNGNVARDDRDFIQFHYDVSNSFYELFLGKEMQYSCAYFQRFDNTLEQAQLDKMDIICRKLQLAPGEHLLDIGCGWGGLVCHAATKFGVHAHGVTLSRAQYDYAVEKVNRLGLADRVKIELRDYRTLEGHYDKIASIGMYEHVGIANLPTYFKKIRALLPDRGMFLNHGITSKGRIGKGRKKRIAPSKQMILKYIFPGSELDDIGNTVQVMEACGFEVHDVEGWREHYALTCRNWYDGLAANEEEAIRHVGQERYRMWLLYLAGVSAGFAAGSMRLFQVVATKHKEKGFSGQPETRAHLYHEET